MEIDVNSTGPMTVPDGTPQAAIRLPLYTMCILRIRFQLGM